MFFAEDILSFYEAPRPQGAASRKGDFVHIVSLAPAYKAGLAGHVPVNGSKELTTFSNTPRYFSAMSLGAVYLKT
jgi:hypothetical protein